MNKYFKILIITLLIVGLSGCRDLRDDNQEFFNEFKPFFDYTFENGYDVSERQIERSNTITGDLVTEYTIHYEDMNKTQRELVIPSVKQDLGKTLLNDEVLSLTQRSLAKKVKEDILKDYFDEEILVTTQLGHVEFGEPNISFDQYHQWISDREVGIKLSNPIDFFNTEIGESMINSITFIVMFSSHEMKSTLENHQPQIMAQLQELFQGDYSINLSASHKLVGESNIKQGMWE